MSDFDIDRANQDGQELSKFGEFKAQYGKGILLGTLTSIGVAIIWTFLGCVFESEYMLAIVFGIIGIAAVIGRYVPQKTFVGCILGIILCLVSFFLYQFFMAIFGYAYEDSSTFWITLGISVVFGGYYGYKGAKDDE